MSFAILAQSYQLSAIGKEPLKLALNMIPDLKARASRSLGIVLVSMLSLVACGSAKVKTIDPEKVPDPPVFSSSEIHDGPLEIQVQTDRVRTINVTSYGANGQDSGDDTLAFQRALDEVPASGGTVFVPAGSYRISASLRVTKPTTLKGAGQNSVRLIAMGQGYHLIEAVRSLMVSDLQIERADIAAILFDKGISMNFLHAARGTPRAELGVERVSIKGFDMGIYTDGGPLLLITRVRISRVRIETNRLSTATNTTGYTPTVATNNADEVVVSESELIQPRDVHINNIYMIGDERVLVRDNTITNGIGFKQVSGQFRPIKEINLLNNRFQNTSLSVLLISETEPFEQVVIQNNQFSRSRVLSEGSSDVQITTQKNFVAQPYAYKQVKLSGNHFQDVARGVIRVEMGPGNEFGSLVLDGNTYERWGTLSPRSYNVISTGNYGSYGQLIVNNEQVNGQGVGRAYLGATKFSSASFGQLNERDVAVPDSTRNERARLGAASRQATQQASQAPASSSGQINLSESDLRRLTGKYFLRQPRTEISITLDGGQLIANVPRNPIYHLAPVSQTYFRAENVADDISFRFDLFEGRVNKLTITSKDGIFVLSPMR
jgi:hypothetical protein